MRAGIAAVAGALTLVSLCACAQMSDARIREWVTEIAASEQTLPLSIEYDMCPANASSGPHHVHVSIPLLLGYKMAAGQVEVISTSDVVALRVPTIQVRLVATPKAFQDHRNDGMALNAADAGALVKSLAVHAAALGDYFSQGGGHPTLAANVANRLAGSIATRAGVLNDTRRIDVSFTAEPRADLPMPDVQLCAGTTLTPTFPREFPEQDFLARGAFPVEGGWNDESQPLREYLKNAAGKVIAYRDKEVTLREPIGTFESVNSAPALASASGANGEKIVNGTLVADGAMPWAVAFMRTAEGGKAEAFCGGTLISSHWAVTAAHCRIAERADAVIGRTDLAATDKGVVKQVKSVWRHIAFGSAARYDSDIALVELSSAVTGQSATISSARLDHSNVTVAGWGATEEGGKTVTLLNSVELDVEPQDTCVLKYESTNASVTPNMFCASKARERKDACQGDSGGGSFLMPRRNTYELVGIVSFGKGCATPGFPGVYTKIAMFSQWLAEVQRATGVQ